MIPLRIDALSDAREPFVTRLSLRDVRDRSDSVLIEREGTTAVFAGNHGLVVLDQLSPEDLDQDVILIHPLEGRAERLLRARSSHNSLLVTERCDQLCVMCSQPPKKTHVDRFSYFADASRLAPQNAAIGITGGEPMLYKERLFRLIERTFAERPDLSFHVLTNGQHFSDEDVAQLRSPAFGQVTWGIPLYAPEPDLHDEIVGKAGAFERLHSSFGVLLQSGAKIELRTVLLQPNAAILPTLATYIVHRLRFIQVWSIMQLEHIGFAKNRWDKLYYDHRNDFAPVQNAIDAAQVHAVAVRLFNFPRCSVPLAYRPLAAASISDWKRKLMPSCAGCREQQVCTGFFAWHPENHPSAQVSPL